MSDRENAIRLALLKVLGEMLGETKTAANHAVWAEWQPGDRLTATLPNGQAVGTVTLANGKTTANVTDLDAYEAWAGKAHPEWIETVTITRVNLDATTRLLAAARKRGVAVDAETGEEVPGITVAEGDPYPLVKLAEDARHAVAAAWRDGSLTELVSGLLAIEGGE